MILLWVAWLVGCRQSDQAPCAGCDVVWITVDSLRVDRVGAYSASSNLTPSVDALARRGTTFRTAIAQGPHTLGPLAMQRLAFHLDAPAAHRQHPGDCHHRA